MSFFNTVRQRRPAAIDMEPEAEEEDEEVDAFNSEVSALDRSTAVYTCCCNGDILQNTIYSSFGGRY